MMFRTFVSLSPPALTVARFVTGIKSQLTSWEPLTIFFFYRYSAFTKESTKTVGSSDPPPPLPLCFLYDLWA